MQKCTTSNIWKKNFEILRKNKVSRQVLTDCGILILQVSLYEVANPTIGLKKTLIKPPFNNNSHIYGG